MAGASGVAQLAALILAAAGHAQAQREQAEQARPLQTGNPVVDHIGPDIIGDGGAR